MTARGFALAIVAAVAVTGCGQGEATSTVPAGAPQGTLEPAVERGGGLSSASLVPLPPFFADSSPWNTPIRGGRVAKRSTEMLSLAGIRRGVVESEGGRVHVEDRLVREGVYINTTRWTTPIVTDAGGRETRVFCRQADCVDSGSLRTLRIPPDVDPDPRFDGWLTVVDRRRGIAWDLWRARRQADGSISYQYAKRWELSGPGFDAPGTVSARGSGLPLFAGVITRQEARAHRIDHALAISVPGPARRSYVQPASATDGVGDERSLPQGARIRLRPGVSVESPPGTSRALTQAIVRALRTYGAIVVDRAAVPTLYAQKDVTARLVRGDELQGLHLDDFEVMPLGRRYAYPPGPRKEDRG